jgi:hypothetical protein
MVASPILGAAAVEPAVLDLIFAGIKWRLINHCENLRLSIDSRTKEFLSHDTRPADALIDVFWGEQFDPPGNVLFDAGLWRAYAGEKQVFDFQSVKFGPKPYKRAIFDSDFTKGEIWLNRDPIEAEEEYYPFEYPLDELAMMHRLALGHGVELHSCGLATPDGRGYLFIGHSGAGKSTMGKLWVKERNARILSDDRVIITRKADGFWLHGTPWHGEAGLAANASAALNAIFLIQHGASNELLSVSAPAAAAELFSRTFVPWYRAAALEFALGFVQAVVTHVPVYILRFLPDASVVPFLETHCAI